MLSFAENFRPMKNFIYLLSCVLVLCRCGIDYGDTTGRPLPRLDYSTEDEPSVETDTTIFVSAIIMNDDYDWRRDTAKRTCGCELVLLKDKEKILSLEVSEDNFISPDPDMHHIIDGHLYTDFSTKCETIIKCDGSIILRYPGREYLCGLLLKDGHLYTLGQNRDSDGFSLRKDGEAIYMKSSGTLSGSFSGTSYGSGGGLFIMDSDICFVYTQRIAGKPRRYMVKGVDETELATPYDEGELGYIMVSDAGRYYTYDPARSNIPVPFEVTIFDRKYYFFSTECGYLSGDTLFLVLTPLERGFPCMMLINETLEEIDIGNGFLTGVSVSVCPADGS